MSFEITFKKWSHPRGQIRYGYVPWDSEIFGFAFYQLYFPKIIQGLSESLHDLLPFLVEESKGKCLVFAKVPSHDTYLIQKLTTQGFYPVEIMVEPFRELRSFKASSRFERLQLRPALVGDRPRLLEIARSAFSMDRYHLDPNLPKDRASYRYEYWLDNGIKSGDPVFVYEDTVKRKSFGFCYLKEVTPGVVDLSLAAVDPGVQKAGFGVMMYSECLNECQKRGYKQVVTRISLNNISVLNIFAHLGFLFRNPTFTLHGYFDDSKSSDRIQFQAI